MKLKLLIICLVVLLPFTSTAQITAYDINKTSVFYTSDPNFLTVFKGKLYVIANDSTHGYELWGIDTLTGEFLVADINPGWKGIIPGKNYGPTTNSRSIEKMAVAYVESMNTEVMFFIADNGTHGNELYMYDGVNAPTMAKEIIAGPQGLKEVTNMVANKEFVFFYERDKGIWQYNVNSGDVKLLPNTDDMGTHSQMVFLNNKLYATLYRGNLSKHVLYEYNPTTGDTNIIANNLVTTSYIVAISNRLYFNVENNILAEFNGATIKTIASYYPTAPWSAGAYKSKIYYTGLNKDIYSYDPITNNKKLVFKNDLFGNGFNAHHFIEYDGKMYFNAKDSVQGYELWEWDGVNQPVMTANIHTSPLGSSDPYNFLILGGGLYFIAINSEGRNVGAGQEVHRYNPYLTSVQKLSFKGDVRVYPNPTTNTATFSIKLETTQTLSIDLYSTDGKKILSIPPAIYTSGSSKATMNISNLPSGNYFYHVINKENTTVISGKLVKM